MTEEIKFEKALERLEKIVEELETGNISLDEALKKYEEGIRLSRACQKKLSEAEKKIEILTRSLDGTLKKEPFEIREENLRNSNTAARGGESSENSKRARKTAGREPASDNEDLLF